MPTFVRLIELPLPPNPAEAPKPWRLKPKDGCAPKGMPTLLLPVSPNSPDGSVGVLGGRLVRVKPTRAILMKAGEKVCTQPTPKTLVGE